MSFIGLLGMNVCFHWSPHTFEQTDLVWKRKKAHWRNFAENKDDFEQLYIYNLFRCAAAHAIGINFHFSNGCRSFIYIIHIKMSLDNPMAVFSPKFHEMSTMLVLNLVFLFQISNGMLDGWLADIELSKANPILSWLSTDYRHHSNDSFDVHHYYNVFKMVKIKGIEKLEISYHNGWCRCFHWDKMITPLGLHSETDSKHMFEIEMNSMKQFCFHDCNNSQIKQQFRYF